MLGNSQQDRALPSAIDADQFVSENLALMAMNARMARDFLETGDVPGFHYSLRCLMARAKAVAGLVNDLGSLSEGGRDHGLR